MEVRGGISSYGQEPGRPTRRPVWVKDHLPPVPAVGVPEPEFPFEGPSSSPFKPTRFNIVRASYASLRFEVVKRPVGFKRDFFFRFGRHFSSRVNEDHTRPASTTCTGGLLLTTPSSLP